MGDTYSSHYRVYCGGIEFGMDYPTKIAAAAAMAAYAKNFPRLSYTVRRHTKLSTPKE